MREVKIIVVHCSDTPNERTLFEGKRGEKDYATPAQVIDRWHSERGFHRDPIWRARQEMDLESIGYHFVIARNGALFNGRHLDEIGAHAQGLNKTSLGVCLVGRDAYTPEQFATLADLLKGLCARYKLPGSRPEFVRAGNTWQILRGGICGHRNLPGVAKTCPGFDAQEWAEREIAPRLVKR